jgi:hypothetical protein
MEMSEPVMTEEIKRSATLKKPKKPMSGYILFTIDRRNVLRAAQMEIFGKDFLREMGKEWKALDDDRRELYESKADTLKAKYAEEWAAYCTERQGTLPRKRKAKSRNWRTGKPRNES